MVFVPLHSLVAVSRRTLLTLSTAACLLGLFGLYELIVSPLVSPGLDLGEPIAQAGAAPPRAPNPDNQTQADRFLADQPWVADAKFQVRNNGAYLFFRDFEKLDASNHVRFKPFAMIWREPKDPPDKEPIVIICDSALVEFAQKFDIHHSPKPGRIVGGALEGAVIVRGPDNMSLKGRDFRFKEGARSVWSDYPIAFTQGPHRGKGQSLELDLIPETGPPDDDKPAIAGVRTIRVVKDVEMNLVSAPKREGEPGETVRVTSAGSFEFDVESKVASFHKDVRVHRPTGDGLSDRLECERLTLIFESGSQEHRDRQQDSPLGGGDLQFRRLRAEGLGTWVTSDRAQLQGWMQELTYDLESRCIVLRDDARRVRLVQKDNELVCPEITATLDEDGQIVQAACRGAGRLYRYVAGTAQAEKTGTKRPIDFAGEWLRELRMEPDTKNGLDMIVFNGQAVLSQTGRMGLKGEVVRLWVTPDRDDGSRRDDDRQTGFGEGQGSTRPRKMLAVGDVEFQSPKIEGKTKRLEVWFDEGPLPRPPADDDEEPGEHPQHSWRHAPAGLSSAARRAMAAGNRDRRPPVVRLVADRGAPIGRAALADVPDPRRKPAKRAKATPAKNAAKNAAQSPAERRPVEQPLDITADLIQVRLMTEGDNDPQLAEVITEGRLKITQQRGPGEEPLRLGGDKLRLRNYSETHQVIHVSGQRAHVADRGLQLEGEEIHFDRGRNVMRVAGAGVLRFPVKQGFDGKPFAVPQTLDVFWDEKMRFDGQTADFYRNVHTQLDGTDMRCEQMHVMLSQRIDFADEDANRGKDPEVQRVACRDGVKMSSRAYEGNRLTEIREAEAFELSIDRSTGAISGQGPGKLILRTRGGGNRAGIGGTSGAKANQPRKADTSEWDYTRIVFYGSMAGNIDRQTTRFVDLRQIVYGPVASSTDEIDADELPLNGAWMRCKSLDLEQHPRQSGQPAQIKMVGQGDVYIHGRTEEGRFNAQAARVSFDQAKGLYSLFGEGRSKATIWRESDAGGDRAPISGQRLEFNPSRNEVNINRASSAEVGQ